MMNFTRLTAFALVAFVAFGARAETGRTAVISSFPSELVALMPVVSDKQEREINGVTFVTGMLESRPVVLFPSGISMVNAAMVTQLALDHYQIKRIVFSGIVGGVDPGLNIGDVVVADRWSQYLEMVFARNTDEGWVTPPFFTYPYANYEMMFPRALTLQRKGVTKLETRFWFYVDPDLLAVARTVAADVKLESCLRPDACLSKPPKVVVGGAGVSGSAFIDNADFRAYIFNTYQARVLDMESAAVAHVAYANDVPFIAFRSLSDLAGGGEEANEIVTFLGLASGNAAALVRAFLRRMPD